MTGEHYLISGDDEPAEVAPVNEPAEVAPVNEPAHLLAPSTVLTDLLDAGLTLDELRAVALVGDDPNSPEMIKSWLESKREVALGLAGASLAGVIAAFVGDATVIATSHGVLTGGTETGAVIGMTGLMGACGVSAAYYLRKVRALADKSLRVQHLLNRRRRLR